MWRVYKESGRPWPQISEDDVLDYMVMEAVAMKVNREDEEERKSQERARWKKETAQKMAKQFS